MTKQCLQCKKEYQTTDKRRKFCSNKCYWKKSSLLGNAGQFKKDNKVWNKGIKGLHLSPDTEFKKGQRGVNRVDIGTTSDRRDQNGTLRKWIKIKEPNIWIEYSKYIWLKSGRKLKKNYCLHHINNNSFDDRLENLVFVSRQDHPKLHNRWNTKNIK